MYLEVEVRSETVSCITYKADFLSLIYLISYIDQQLAAVSVSCFLTVIMRDVYAKSVS